MRTNLLEVSAVMTKLREGTDRMTMALLLDFQVAPAVTIVTLWSSSEEFLAANPEVPGSIPGAARFSE
jgi:hypothetical protein